MPRIELTPLPPAEAVRFFRGKGFDIGFDWRDVWQDERAQRVKRRPYKKSKSA